MNLGSVTSAASSPVLARGVSSGARLRSDPLVLSSAAGSRVRDRHGREYVDFILGMGPVLLGHGRREVLDRVSSQLEHGVLFGTTESELELAERLKRLLPHAEHVAFVNSGSEGTHLAIRIARASTGRNLILKFEGHYHGWVDPLFANTQNNRAGDGAGIVVPGEHSVEGLPVDSDVIVGRWNAAADLRPMFEAFGDRLAAVILEPIPMNFGTMLPQPGYMESLRALCDESGTLLIYDEVLSGFRLGLGGAAGLLGVSPDMAVYAKAMANGFPMAAVVGVRSAMESIVSGPVFPAGTYSGSPVSVAAALATLDILQAEAKTIYPRLEELGARLKDAIERIARQENAPLVVSQVGSVLQLFWGLGGPPDTYAAAARSDRSVIARICEAQQDRGLLVSPRGLLLLSAVHTAEDVDALAAGIGDTLRDEGLRALYA